MTDQETKLIGHSPEGDKLEAVFHQHEIGTAGPIVHVIEHQRFNSIALPFLNDTKGKAMNQDVAFGVNKSIIHDGGTTSSKLTGTATSQNNLHLLDSGETFSTIEVGMGVHNTTDNTYASVTAVATNDLTLDANIFPVGSENYTLDPVWVGSATQGSWDFSTGGDISLTNGVEGDQADFRTVGPITYKGENFTALSGKINLQAYSGANHGLTICFTLADTLVGNIVDLEVFIDVGDFSQQSFSIPLSEFGVAGETFDGFRLMFSRAGGVKGAIDFDDLLLETSGESLVYTVGKPRGSKALYIDSIHYTFVGSLDVTVANGTMPGLSYNKILNLTKLPNGMVFRRVEAGVTQFSLNLKQLVDFTEAGGEKNNEYSNSSNETGIGITVNFPRQLRLFGAANVDFLSLTINDPMNGLLVATAFARGGVLV